MRSVSPTTSKCDVSQCLRRAAPRGNSMCVSVLMSLVGPRPAWLCRPVYPVPVYSHRRRGQTARRSVDRWPSSIDNDLYPRRGGAAATSRHALPSPAVRPFSNRRSPARPPGGRQRRSPVLPARTSGLHSLSAGH